MKNTRRQKVFKYWFEFNRIFHQFVSLLFPLKKKKIFLNILYPKYNIKSETPSLYELPTISLKSL